MLAIVPWAYLHCSFQNCIMPYSTMVVRSPGRAECQAPQLFADFAGFPKNLLTIPAVLCDNRIIEHATHHARVFVNGVEVAQHEGGFLPFDAVVTDIVRYNQFNKLSVLLNNELNEHMLPAGNTTVLSNGKKIAAPTLISTTTPASTARSS